MADGPSGKGNNMGAWCVQRDDEILSRSSPRRITTLSHTCDIVVLPNIVVALDLLFSAVAVESHCTSSRIGWVICLSPTTPANNSRLQLPTRTRTYDPSITRSLSPFQLGLSKP
jgi:hypothetical protein